MTTAATSPCSCTACHNAVLITALSLSEFSSSSESSFNRQQSCKRASPLDVSHDSLCHQEATKCRVCFSNDRVHWWWCHHKCSASHWSVCNSNSFKVIYQRPLASHMCSCTCRLTDTLQRDQLSDTPEHHRQRTALDQSALPAGLHWMLRHTPESDRSSSSYQAIILNSCSRPVQGKLRQQQHLQAA
jgi:hypothetical protein